MSQIKAGNTRILLPTHQKLRSYYNNIEFLKELQSENMFLVLKEGNSIQSAVGVGFEPTLTLLLNRFSRPARSTAPASHLCLSGILYQIRKERKM